MIGLFCILLDPVRIISPDLDIAKPAQDLKVDKVGKARAGEVKADEFADTYTANLKSLEDGVYSSFKTLQDENVKNGIKSKDFDELSNMAVGDLLKSSSPSINFSDGNKTEFLSDFIDDALSDIPCTVAKPLSEQNFVKTSSGSKFKYLA